MGMTIRAIFCLSAILLVVAAFAGDAAAVPLYARQTGQQCAACHNGFPELTPYGRLFKLNGYTFGGGQSDLPPVAAMAVVSFNHTEAPQQGGAAPHYAANDNLAWDFASIFYGGVILPDFGAFGQVTYDAIGRRLGWDNTDFRYAKSVEIAGDETIFGVSLNNNPTVTDVWNSTPAWGYPWLASGLAPTPAAATLIQGGLAQDVLGVTAYTYWNRLVYGEIGLYRTLSDRTLTTLGTDPTGGNSIKNAAPYWRFAIEPKWGANSFEIGTFGLAATMVPGRTSGFGTDHTVDIGFDAQYQYLAEHNSVSFDASWITENDGFTASEALGNTSNGRDHLRSLNLKASYFWDQTYGGTLSRFRIDGSGDPLLYGASSIDNSPNSDGWIAEFDYIPFNHGGPDFWPWLNLKLGVQYTWYSKFDGAAINFDGAGHSAGDNNTLYLFTWLAF
jgi:hypothetical protein